MKKCPVCKVGSMVPSGSHNFCSNCGFVSFVMTDEYLNACGHIIGVLVSNCQYPDHEAYMRNCNQLINLHLPLLASYMGQIENGVDVLHRVICDLAADHAINLIINEAPPEELPETKLTLVKNPEVN